MREGRGTEHTMLRILGTIKDHDVVLDRRRLIEISPGPDKLLHLTNVTSDLQARINNQQENIMGAASTVLSSNLGSGRVMVSDANGK